MHGSKHELSPSQKELLDNYQEQLKKQKLSSSTIYNYVNSVKKFIIRNNLQSIEAIDSYLQSHKKVTVGSIHGLSHLLKQHNILYMKHKPYKNHPIRKESLRAKLGFTEYDASKDEYVQRFQKERNLMDSTMQGHQNALNIYIPLNGFQSAKEMIEEAYEDEKKGLPPKNARIKEHLSQYLITLRDNLDNPRTVHTYFTKLETFYRHYDITLPSRPPMQVKNNVHVSYEDLPTKDMIRTAIEQSELDMKALILFMSSSGTALAESLNMRIKDLIKGLKYHTDKTDINQVIDELRGKRDIVPCIPMLRIKTDVPYYTCCSPEASYYLFEYLNVLRRDNNICDDDKVFYRSKNYVIKKFQRINDNNGWGVVANYRRFHSHALRKFHASNLGCSFDVINMLEGRSNGTIHQTYVKTQPEKLRIVYMKYMHNVMIKPDEFGFESEFDKMKNYVDEKIHGNTQNDCFTNVGHTQDNVLTTTRHTNTDVLVQLQELTKQVGVLEYRIQQLEKQGG